jgi:cytochrome b subunit of formate dehydrogenase
VAWESAWPVRGIVHRVAAGVFLASAALHLIALAASARLREHWTLMWPRRPDLGEAIGAFAYNLGLRATKPPISAHSYIEKAEYWAVVWGAVIMGASGVLLWANNFFLARVSKTVMDLATVVHFYEAVLATLAIVVWHFYFVIFDPDVYPMDTAWLSGHSSRPRDHH